MDLNYAAAAPEVFLGLAICVVLFLPLFGGIGLLMSLVLAISEAYLAPIAHALGLAVGF